jgi:hypothetical protein
MADAENAKKLWEAENQVQVVKPDQIYGYDEEAYRKYLQTKPWTKEYVSVYRAVHVENVARSY